MIRGSLDEVCRGIEDANFANTVIVDTAPSVWKFNEVVAWKDRSEEILYLPE